MEKIKIHYNLTDEQYSSLDKLLDLVIEYNKSVNITGINSKDEAWVKHIADSLELLNVINLKDKSILDIGTGAGFPGLVLAVMSPSSEFTLIDSNNKKITFVKHAIQKLELENVKTETTRVEDQVDEYWEMFDVVVSRAVAPLNVLLELSAFTVNIGGKLVLFKGPNYKSETPLEWNEIKTLGINQEHNTVYKLDDNILRHFLIFKKENPTNEKYPRKYNQIINDPIF